MFACLQREVARRHGWYLAVEPVYDPYRDDPRFAELLETAGHGPVARKQPGAGFGTSL